jgi:Flp pilus assembly protein CpaB
MSENPDRKMFDDLKHSVPVARAPFQRDLEKRLLTRLQEKEKTAMTTLPVPARRPNNYRPLAAAAVLVMMLASVLLWEGGRPPSPGKEMVIGQPGTASPTPVVMINVLIARQNLPRGYRFPDDGNALNEVVGYVPLPDYAVPVSALTESDNSLEKLSGQYLRTDVVREQTLLSTLLASDLSDLANIGVQTNVYESVVVSLKNLKKGEAINEDSVTTVFWPPASVPEGAINDVKRLENHILQRDVTQWQPILASDLQLQLPNGTVAVTIPIQLLESVAGSVTEGDHVNIWASFLFVNVGSPAGTPGPLLLNPQGTIMPQTVITLPPDAQLQMPVTGIPGNAQHSTAQRTTQVIVHDALVVQVSKLCGQGDVCDDVMVLAVSPQEADVLQWAINAKLPLRLVKVGGK